MKREQKISFEYTSNSKKKKRKITEADEQEEIERNKGHIDGCHLIDSSGNSAKNEVGTVMYDLSEAIEFDPRLIE